MRMQLTYTRRPYGDVRYYTCSSRLKKRERVCPAQAVSADLLERLAAERISRHENDSFSAESLQSKVERMTYDSTSGRLDIRLKNEAVPCSQN